MFRRRAWVSIFGFVDRTALRTDHLCFFYSPCAESIEMSHLVTVNCHVQRNNRWWALWSLWYRIDTCFVSLQWALTIGLIIPTDNLITGRVRWRYIFHVHFQLCKINNFLSNPWQQPETWSKRHADQEREGKNILYPGKPSKAEFGTWPTGSWESLVLKGRAGETSRCVIAMPMPPTFFACWFSPYFLFHFFVPFPAASQNDHFTH